jgi:hypothetical protein
VRLIFYLLLLCASVFYALRQGGGPERAAAITFILMNISDPFVHAFTPTQFDALDPGHLIIDFLGWLALFTIALRAKRFWPLWVSSLQTISLIAHVAKFLDYSIHPIAYFTMQVASSYLYLVVLIIGTYYHQKRRKKNGNDPSWRS